jgi:hypothetical protein
MLAHHGFGQIKTDLLIDSSGLRAAAAGLLMADGWELPLLFRDVYE